MAFIGLAFIAAGIGASYAGLIYGWGLEPVSWPMIIGTSIASLVFIGIGQVCAHSGK